MDISIISQRYALALFNLALEMDKIDRMSSDMNLVLEVTRENPEFRRLLASPIIPERKKTSIIKGIFEKHLDPLSFRFLQLVTRKEREVYLENICEHFALLYKKHKNIITIEITTAYPIDDEIRTKIIALIEDTQKKKVELTEKIDEKIIGGVVLRVDDKKYDASLRRQLLRLRKVFDKNLYVKGY